MPKKLEKSKESIYPKYDKELIPQSSDPGEGEELIPESTDPSGGEIFAGFKKEKNKKEYRVEIVSNLYVWYFKDSGQMARTPNIWLGIKVGETIYL
jgi:hypothetical protein